MLMQGKDPAEPESYDHPVLKTPRGDLARPTHGHGPLRFEFVQPGSPYKVGDPVPHELTSFEANAAAIRWLENTGATLGY